MLKKILVIDFNTSLIKTSITINAALIENNIIRKDQLILYNSNYSCHNVARYW